MSNQFKRSILGLWFCERFDSSARKKIGLGQMKGNVKNALKNCVNFGICNPSPNKNLKFRVIDSSAPYKGTDLLALNRSILHCRSMRRQIIYQNLGRERCKEYLGL
jgi:hypothetical protein